MNETLATAIVLFIVMWYAIPFAHELGHALACESYGYQARVFITNTGEARLTICSETPENPEYIYAAGGLMGAGVAAVPLVIRKRTALAASVPFIAQNLVLAAMETFAYEWYISPTNYLNTVIASSVGMVMFIFLLLKLRLLKRKERVLA